MVPNEEASPLPALNRAVRLRWCASWTDSRLSTDAEVEPVVRLGAADSTSGELSGLDEKPDQSRRCEATSIPELDMVLEEGAGGEIATTGAPFLRKLESEGEEARGLDLLTVASGEACLFRWEASKVVETGVMICGHGGRLDAALTVEVVGQQRPVGYGAESRDGRRRLNGFRRGDSISGRDARVVSMELLGCERRTMGATTASQDPLTLGLAAGGGVAQAALQLPALGGRCPTWQR